MRRKGPREAIKTRITTLASAKNLFGSTLPCGDIQKARSK